MNTPHTLNIVGQPCPLGEVAGVWSILLKIVLIMTLVFMPIFAVTNYITVKNLYVVKTREHNELALKFQTAEHRMEQQLQEINTRLDQLLKRD